jgi:hypothetical protein
MLAHLKKQRVYLVPAPDVADLNVAASRSASISTRNSLADKPTSRRLRAGGGYLPD